MIRSQWLGAATALALLGGLGISAAEAQQAGSATALQPKPGAEAQQQQVQPGSTVEKGVPASPHQQEVLRGDENAQPGQNMTTTGPAGQGSAETPHQQEVLKPQTGQSQ
jgi:hypothetical protein